MTYWEKYISEGMTAAQKKKAAEKVMSDLTGKKKKKKNKGDKIGLIILSTLSSNWNLKEKNMKIRKKEK